MNQIIDIQTLKCLSIEDSYSYKLLTDILKSTKISESNLYSSLKRLDGAGYVNIYNEKYYDRLRKYYKITNAGKDRLVELEINVKEGGIKNMKNDNFRTFDYTSIVVSKNMEPVYIDTYESFGWELTDNELGIIASTLGGSSKLSFRRDRRINNKSELLKIQRKCEELFANIRTMESNKTKNAFVNAIGLGLLGCAFLAGSMFLFLAESWILFVILGAIGIGLWIPPYFIHKKTVAKDTKRLNPLIDEQYDKISDLCEEANSLIKSSEN